MNNLGKLFAKLGIKLVASALQQTISASSPASNPAPAPVPPDIYKSKEFFVRNISGKPVLLAYRGHDNFVTVPNVVIVYPNCFRSNPAISHVIFPESVFRIYGNCFIRCENLTSVNIMNPHCQVAKSMFLDCPKISRITMHGKSLDILSADACELRVSFRYLCARSREDEEYALLSSMNVGRTQKFVVAVAMLQRYENEELAEEFLKYRIHEALHAVASDQKTVSFLLERFGQYVYPAVFPKLIEYSRKNNFTESQIAFMEFCNKNSVNTDNIGNLSL